MTPRDINGFLLLDKPGGLTSNRALQKAKRLFEARKAGHTGSLDPLATGMLPICFGAATRVAQYVLAADKSYEVTALLGARTDTDDADGAVIEEREVPAMTEEALDPVLAGFIGASTQTPPMYSAIKHEGKRLYQLARQGRVVARKERPITLHALELISLAPPELRLRIVCSKGTYVRTLVTDIAAALGTVGHVTGLRRLSVDPFAGERMRTLDELEALAHGGREALDATLRPTDSVLVAWPKLMLDAEGLRRIKQGQTIRVGSVDTIGRHRIYSAAGEFIGVGEVNGAGDVAPRRILG